MSPKIFQRSIPDDIEAKQIFNQNLRWIDQKEFTEKLKRVYFPAKSPYQLQGELEISICGKKETYFPI